MGASVKPSLLDDVVSRRRFLSRISVALSGLAGAVVSVPVLAYLFSPFINPPRNVWRQVGAVDTYTVGSTVNVAIEEPSPLPWAGQTAQTAVWLRRDDANSFTAFSVNCAHLGCPVNWRPDSGLFLCPCQRGGLPRRRHCSRGTTATTALPVPGPRPERYRRDPNRRAAARMRRDGMMRLVRHVLCWLDDRLGFSKAGRPLIEHPVPPNLNWWYVLGSATLVAFMVQIVTGVALAFSYVPAPNSAYQSLQFITNDAVLGRVVRGLHYFGSSAMVVLMVAHMTHVFLSGAFKFPREANWLSGVMLSVLTMGMAFAGQTLRWSQDAYWTVVVGAEQAARAPMIGDFLARILIAGQTVGGATLTRFYATHVFLLPALMFAVIGFHLFLVIYHGISEPPKVGEPVDPKTYRARYHAMLEKVGVPFWPDAAWKDVVFAVGVSVIVLALAILVGPPDLGAQADPTNVHADPRPDWYFLWYFALLSLVPAGIEDYFMIGFPLLIGVALVLLPLLAPAGERSPQRRPWAVGLVVFTLVAIGGLNQLGQAAPWSPVLEAQTLPSSVTDGLTGNEVMGAQLFQQKDCIACHTIAGVGGQRGPNLTDVGDRLSHDQLTWRILTGGTNMPAYGQTLTPDQLAALVEFLGRRQANVGSADDSFWPNAELSATR